MALCTIIKSRKNLLGPPDQILDLHLLKPVYSMRLRLRFTLIYAARSSHNSIDSNVKMFTQTQMCKRAITNVFLHNVKSMVSGTRK